MPESESKVNFGIFVAVLAGFIGVLYGYDMGTFNAVLPFWKDDFQLTPLTEGLLGSSPLIGMLIGTIVGGNICDAIGRQKSLALILFGFTLTALLATIPISPWWLFSVRLCLGFFVGLSLITTPLFIGEFAPKNIRGRLLAGYQITQSVGHILATFVGFLIASSGNWEIVVGIAALPAVILLLIIGRFPDTPRWYVYKGELEKARRVMNLIEDEATSEKEIEDIRTQIAREEKQGGKIREIFNPKLSKRLIFAVGFGLLVHVTGGPVVNFYSTVIFQNIGYDLKNSLILTGSVQFTALAAELAASLLVDRLGRRPTLLSGVAILAVSLFALLLSFTAGFEGDAAYIAVAALICFRIGFGLGFGSLIWVYIAECFPLRLRGIGATFILVSNTLGTIAVTQSFPLMTSYFGGGFAWAVFLVMAVIAWMFIFFLAPETKGRTLEEINEYWLNNGRWPDGTASHASKPYAA